MKLVIVGGYHNKKVVEVNSVAPIRLFEDLEEISCSRKVIDAELMTFNFHEYIPQSIGFGMHENKILVLVPRNQSVAETIEIMVNSHGETL